MSLGADIISRVVKTQKLFNFQAGRCTYLNIEASRKNQKIQEEPVIKIVNTVCKQSGARLVKVTQIRFKEKLIVIEDEYCFRSNYENGEMTGQKNSSQQTKSSDGSNHSNPLTERVHKVSLINHKKKLIFKKKYLEENSRIEKRNTKNIAKNFCKAFINYLQESNKGEALMKAKQVMAYYNYNNKTIEAMGKDQQLKQDFKEFLSSKAEDWVQSSKIHDKKIHREAIQLYLSLMESKAQQNSDIMGQSNYKMINGNSGKNDDQQDDSVYESDQIFNQCSPNSKINRK